MTPTNLNEYLYYKWVLWRKEGIEYANSNELAERQMGDDLLDREDN